MITPIGHRASRRQMVGKRVKIRLPRVWQERLVFAHNGLKEALCHGQRKCFRRHPLDNSDAC